MEISVIIPVYNTEQYLEECLDSMVGQYFKDWECLLIDDGSSDRSGYICDMYANLDTRFRVFHTKNSGVSVARNLGIGHARGKYIAFIDSDDTVDKEYLSDLYYTMMTNNADLALCGMKCIHSKDVVINLCSEKGVFHVNKENSDRFVDLGYKYLLYGPVIKLYHSSIINEKNISFPKGISYGEDLIFNFKYLEYVNTIAVSEVPSYNYRVPFKNTLSTSPLSRKFHLKYEQWEIIHSFFSRRGLDSPNARTFLSNYLWGLAYDTVMSYKLKLEEIRNIFDIGFIDKLRVFNSYTIAVPGWLRMIIERRLHLLIWMLQRRIIYELPEIQTESV